MLWIWIGLFVLAIFIEAITVSFYSLMFGIGAILSFISGTLGASTTAQVFIFLISSVILLLLVKPLAKKYLTKEIQKTNVDALIGKTAVVTSRIKENVESGEVKVNGIHYKAKSVEGSDIQAGEIVSIEKIEGVTFFVKKHQP